LYVLTTHVTVCVCDTEIRGYYLLTYLLTYLLYANAKDCASLRKAISRPD